MSSRWMLALGAALLVTGCRSIPTTQRGSDRKEIEVAVQVDPLIGRMLRTEEDMSALQEVVSEAVFELADVGLRFYPVPDQSYSPDQKRPEFQLTVDVRALDAALNQPFLYEKNARAREGAFDRLGCVAVVTVSKRRPLGPPLMIGKTVGHGEAEVKEASAVLSSLREFPTLSENVYSNAQPLRADDLAECVREAVRSALSQLIEAIDRELKPAKPQT